MANAIFLKIDGAPGTSLESQHVDWIDIESYSFGGVRGYMGSIATMTTNSSS